MPWKGGRSAEGTTGRQRRPGEGKRRPETAPGGPRRGGQESPRGPKGRPRGDVIFNSAPTPASDPPHSRRPGPTWWGEGGTATLHQIQLLRMTERAL